VDHGKWGGVIPGSRACRGFLKNDRLRKPSEVIKVQKGEKKSKMHRPKTWST